jgi:hypothetical protein
MLLPGHIVGEEGVIVITGNGLIVIVTIDELTHPLASVPVAVYTVVIIGLAVTIAPDVDDNPVAGDQV